MTGLKGDEESIGFEGIVGESQLVRQSLRFDAKENMQVPCFRVQLELIVSTPVLAHCLETVFFHLTLFIISLPE